MKEFTQSRISSSQEELIVSEIKLTGDTSFGADDDDDATGPTPLLEGDEALFDCCGFPISPSLSKRQWEGMRTCQTNGCWPTLLLVLFARFNAFTDAQVPGALVVVGGAGSGAALAAPTEMLFDGRIELPSPRSGFSSLKSAADVYMPARGASEARIVAFEPFVKELSFRVRAAPTLLLEPLALRCSLELGDAGVLLLKGSSS